MKCGRSYPDGSPQILKGCEGCKGTRFFYTQRPIGEKEREELAERTQDELTSGGGKEAGRERRIPTKGELPVGEDRDWVSLGPGNLRTIVEDVVRRAHEKKPTFRVAHPPEEGEDESASPSLEDWVRKRQEELANVEEDEDVEDLSLDPAATREPARSEESTPWPPWPQPARKETGPEPAPADLEDGDPKASQEPEDVVYRRSRRLARQRSARPGPGEPTSPLGADADFGMGGEGEADLPSSLRPLKDGPFEEQEQEEASSESEGGRPETVEVLEQGVYDLDVRRLLDKNPIVVHKDGSYSLHLPSLMESLGKKRR